MRERLNRRMPSAAMVVAIASLCVALGTTAYAAKVKLNAGSVKTKTIKNAAVTEPKLAKGSVTEGKLGPGAVTAGKLAAGAVTTNKLGPCPAGTSLLLGECFETSARAAATWFNATLACGAAGGRLPLSAELNAIRQSPGIDLGTNGSTDNMGAEQIDGQYGAVSDNGTVSVALGVNTARPFRCVVPRS